MVDIKELTTEEKIKHFEKISKRKLIEMLIHCNTMLEKTLKAGEDTSQYNISYVTDKKPYCCPVCGGNGIVPKGFYQIVTSVEARYEMGTEMCRSCIGRGVIMA